MFKNKTDHTCNVTDDKKIWFNKLLDDIGQGLKIAIGINSCVMANDIYYELTNKLAKNKILLITSETDEDEKIRIFRDVNKTLIEYDCVIYTPTLTAGVSFEMEHFDKFYGYFTDGSCDGYTCDQMLGRIRNLSKKEYTLCLIGNKKQLPMDPYTLKKYLKHSRKTIAECLCNIPEMDVDMDELGNYIYRMDDFMTLWIENVCVKNKFKNNFVSLMIDMMKQKGCKINKMGEIPKELQEAMKNLLVNARKQNLDDRATKIEAAEYVFNPNTGNGLRSEDATTEALKMSLHKQFLHIVYDGAKITKEFVLEYDNRRTINQYLNTKAYLGGLDNYLMNNKDFVFADNSFKELTGDKQLRYNRCKITIDLLKACGYDCIKDSKKIHKDIILQNLKNRKDLFTKKKVDYYNKLFESRAGKIYKPLNTLKQYLGMINSAVDETFGINVKLLQHKSLVIDIDMNLPKGELYIIYNNILIDKLLETQNVDDN